MMWNPPAPQEPRRTGVVRGGCPSAVFGTALAAMLVTWMLGMMHLGTGVGVSGTCAIEISPLTMELRIGSGRTYTDTINLTNDGKDPEHIRVFCQDWAVKPDGVAVFVAAGRLPNSASAWVQVTPTEFDVAPGKTQAVRYTVRVPEDASGESRTVILFEAGAQKLNIPGAPSSLIPRVGTILYVQVGQPPAIQAKVTGFELGPEGGYLSIENQGAGHLRFTGRYEVRSADKPSTQTAGKLVGSGELAGFVVLPAPFNSHRMAVPKEVLSGLGMGEYEVTMLLDCGGPSLLGARRIVSLAPESPSVVATKQ